MNPYQKIVSDFSAGNMDFIAASLALMESQGRGVDIRKAEGNMSKNQIRLFEERLAYYRKLYREPVMEE